MLPSLCSTSTAYQHSFSEATLERKEKLAMALSISLFAPGGSWEVCWLACLPSLTPSP